MSRHRSQPSHSSSTDVLRDALVLVVEGTFVPAGAKSKRPKKTGAAKPDEGAAKPDEGATSDEGTPPAEGAPPADASGPTPSWMNNPS